MRHISPAVLTQLLNGIPGKQIKKRLENANKKLARKRSPKTRQEYIRSNGPDKWSPVKAAFTPTLGNKCWYTEVELVGAHLTIDHFRPCCHYSFLAFDVDNYRVACPFSNSPEHNPNHGCKGGKGDAFPLLGTGARATSKIALGTESPVILDPSKKHDCDLLAFRTDGNPILNPTFANDPIARDRVEQSKLLLNLDHPDFNSKREQLYFRIRDDVKTYEELPPTASMRQMIRDRLAESIAPTAPFSIAAKYHLQCFKNHDWVERILNPP